MLDLHLEQLEQQPVSLGDARPGVALLERR
jgi:hypothetical protein